jgi:hypothetical protein
MKKHFVYLHPSSEMLSFADSKNEIRFFKDIKQ